MLPPAYKGSRNSSIARLFQPNLLMTSSEFKASVGLIGLGPMGQNLALNIERNGYPVIVFDREVSALQSFSARITGKKVTLVENPEAFVQSLSRPRKIILLVKAGAPVDWTIDLIRPYLERDDVVIDAGNSYFKETERRQSELASQGLHLIGSGVSGGEKGALLGPSLMPGGDRKSYEQLRPIWEAIAAKTEDGPCVTYLGPGGAGHFVKMVHNGIEYGDMQLIAESYDLMRRLLGLTASEIADVFEAWNVTELESYLIEITTRILRFIDQETGRPLVDLILDQAGQKGTGQWASATALELGVSVPTIDAAVMARNLSSQKNHRVEVAKHFPPRDNKVSADATSWLSSLRDGLVASRLCCYAQGMNLLKTASDEWNWQIDLAEVARIWQGGCIIRARLLKTVAQAYQNQLSLQSLLLAPEIKQLLRSAEQGWRNMISLAVENGVPVPAASASLAYFDQIRSPESPLNLTQAQRDFFGAHTYERADKPELGPVHTNWEGDHD